MRVHTETRIKIQVANHIECHSPKICQKMALLHYNKCAVELLILMTDMPSQTPLIYL